jgi:hypothetical protein
MTSQQLMIDISGIAILLLTANAINIMEDNTQGDHLTLPLPCFLRFLQPF